MSRPKRDYSRLAQPRLPRFAPQTTKFLIVDGAQNPGPQHEWVSHGVKRKGLDEKKQKQFFDALQDTCTEFEAHGISTLCIEITDHSRLYRAKERGDDAVLRSHNIAGLGTGRDVFLKRFMDTFTDIDDIIVPDSKVWAETVAKNGGKEKFLKKLMDPNFKVESIKSIVKSTTLWNFIIGHGEEQKKLFGGIITGSLNKEDFFGPPTALDYLRESHIDHVVIAGAMAGFCVAGTAISAAMKGLAVTILSDMVVGWENKSFTQAFWNKGSPKHHVQEMEDRFNEIIKNPETAGFNHSDKAALMDARNRIRIIPSSQFIPALKAQANNLKHEQTEMVNGTSSIQINAIPMQAERPAFSRENQPAGNPRLTA